MSLLALALMTATGPTSVTPIDAAASDAISYVLGYGVLGIAAVLFVMRIIVPRTALKDARADLERENERLILEKRQAEEQRDDALRIAQTQIVPMLTSFSSTTAALIPLLQELVRTQEVRGGGLRR